MHLRTIAETYADWALSLSTRDVPSPVVAAARYLMLDASGVGVAAYGFDFASSISRALNDLTEAPGGRASAIGLEDDVATRDAIRHNAMLIHGIDFDDTYQPGTIHSSSAAYPTALAICESLDLSGDDLVLAFVIGTEIMNRVSAAALDGGLIAAGHDPSGVATAFGCAVLAGKLLGASATQIVNAQGMVESLASGSMAFIKSGGWNIRAHPAWAGTAGYEAATYAKHGFLAPRDVYESDLGFYARHTKQDAQVDLNVCTAGLGSEWTLLNVSLKAIPGCHYSHALSDAVVELMLEHDLNPEDIDTVVCGLAPQQIPVVFEPLRDKQDPETWYACEFSAPYVVAASAVYRRFDLSCLQKAPDDPLVRDLAQRVTYEIDPNSAFPERFSGTATVRTHDGRTLTCRKEDSRGGSATPLTEAEIVGKYSNNVKNSLTPQEASELQSAILNGGTAKDVATYLRNATRSGPSD